jgi:hypothetical protein
LSAFRSDQGSRSRYLGFTAPATSFRRPRGLPGIRHSAVRHEAAVRKAPVGLDGPPGHAGNTPPESCAAPATFMGFFAPTATSARRSTDPGFHTRYVPPSGFLALLTVCSLRAFRSRGSVPLVGFTLQSLSPSQSRTPCGAMALVLFLTSCSSALRTRRSRCPAAPGQCSLRGSVPAAGRSPQGPMLSWVSRPLQSIPRTPGDRLPGPFPHALPPTETDERTRRNRKAGTPGHRRTPG